MTLQVASLLVIVCLLIIMVHQQFKIRGLESELQAQTQLRHRYLRATQCPVCQCSKSIGNVDSVKPTKQYAGVAVTTFLGAPKWFQNRYTMMVNQVLALVEDDWVVQIVYDPAVKMALEGIAYAGIRRQIARGRVILTAIPTSMKKIKKNKLLLTSWFWKALVAENVLLFGGTAALCANTNYEVSNFTHFDYIGAPWNAYQGKGGEGGITIRKRSIMEALTLQFEKDALAGKSTGTAREDSVIVRSLVDQKAKLANKEDTIRFAMAGGTATGTPLAVSGTLSGLTDQARQEYLDYCPEMKMMFPSLHNDACFGAEPNALECFKYLCITSRLRCGEKYNEISFTNAKNRKLASSSEENKSVVEQ